MSDPPLRVLYVDDDPALARLVQKGWSGAAMPSRRRMTASRG